MFIFLNDMMDTNKVLDILKKYNYREEIVGDLWYLRTSYLQRLFESLWVSDLVKVLIWQRRVGKSYIMRQLISSLITDKKVDPLDILYLNMEYLELNFIKTSEDLHQVFQLFLSNSRNSTHKKYLFVDEVQEIDGWEKCINSLRADPTIDVEIFISGSNSKLLSGELATYLSWRYLTFDIYPFSYAEFLWIQNINPSRESLIHYLNLWWIPEIYNLPSDELKENYIISLRNTLILKDIAQRYHVWDIDLFEKIFLFLIWNIWNLNSLNAIYKKLQSQNIKISLTTLWNYILYLQEIFVFHGVSRFDTKGKKILEWEKKYYLNDLALLNFWYLSVDRFMGKKLENFVFNQLVQHGFSVKIWVYGKQEIDFIVEKKGKKMYLQVCYLLSDEDVIQREYRSLRSIQDSFPKYVVSMDDMGLPVDDYWIQHCKAWEMDQILF